MHISTCSVLKFQPILANISFSSFATHISDGCGPSYYCNLLTDTFLIIINIFNIFVLFTHLQPLESPLKIPAIKFKHRVVSQVHNLPFVVASTLSTLLLITSCFAAQYLKTLDTTSLIRAIISGYTFAVTCIFVKLSHVMVTLSVDRVLDMEMEVSQKEIIQFKPPSKSVMKALVAPYKPFFPVETIGMDGIPNVGEDGKAQPHLFVSNHSLYGLEMPLVLNELYQQKNIYVRGLADHFHFATPNGPILKAFGAVDGTRENVDVLMKAEQDILVYPGGGHEVLKHSSVPRYELLWKQRLGFARCAIKHQYPIIPCACVGTEDMFDTIGNIPTGYKGLVIPISITTPCRVQKVYMWFGSPIATKQYNGEYTNDEYASEVRDLTKAAIEAGIHELQEKQKNDPDRYLVTKIRNYFGMSSDVGSDGEKKSK